MKEGESASHAWLPTTCQSQGKLALEEATQFLWPVRLWGG